MVEEDNKILEEEKLRLTVIATLTAAFLTLIINWDKIFPIQNNGFNLLIYLKTLMYGFFISSISLFVLYFFSLAKKLKYKKEEKDSKASDFSICLWYLLLWIFDRKTLKKYDKESFEEKANRFHKDNYKFLYDVGVSLFSTTFLTAIGYCLIYFTKEILTSLLPNISSLVIGIISVTISLFLIIISLITLNFFKFKITGKQ